MGTDITAIFAVIGRHRSSKQNRNLQKKPVLSSSSEELNESILPVLQKTVKHMLTVALQAKDSNWHATELLFLYMCT